MTESRHYQWYPTTRNVHSPAHSRLFPITLCPAFPPPPAPPFLPVCDARLLHCPCQPIVCRCCRPHEGGGAGGCHGPEGTRAHCHGQRRRPVSRGAWEAREGETGRKWKRSRGCKGAILGKRGGRGAKSGPAICCFIDTSIRVLVPPLPCLIPPSLHPSPIISLLSLSPCVSDTCQ